MTFASLVPLGTGEYGSMSLSVSFPRAVATLVGQHVPPFCKVWPARLRQYFGRPLVYTADPAVKVF